MAEHTHLLSTDLVDRLRIEILTGRLRPGEKLTEQSICGNFSVSRTPVREALKNLEAEGLIEMIPNRGAFVVGFSAEEIHDLFILRMHSEMQALCWAIERRTEAEMEAIEESFDFMRFYTERGDIKRMRPINADFHKQIAAASHNRIIIENLTRTQQYIRFSSHVTPYRETDLETILNEHEAIFIAITANDPVAGAAAMKSHIENSIQRANV